MKLVALFATLAVSFAFYAFAPQPLGVRNNGQEKNHIPVVNIIEPQENSAYSENALIRYSIAVSDKEDGESKYDEIRAAAIFLEVSFFKDSAVSVKARQRASRKWHPGLHKIKQSDCFTCHQFKTRLIGPSFAEIARRYGQEKNASEVLARRVRQGSQHIWGEAIMPAHPSVSAEASAEMVDWILNAGLDTEFDILAGKEGSFRPSATWGSGQIQLRATYTDSGTKDEAGSELTGEDLVMIRYR